MLGLPGPAVLEQLPLQTQATVGLWPLRPVASAHINPADVIALLMTVVVSNPALRGRFPVPIVVPLSILR